MEIMRSSLFLLTKNLVYSFFFDDFSFLIFLTVLKLKANIVLQEDDVDVEPVLPYSNHSFFLGLYLSLFFQGRIKLLSLSFLCPFPLLMRLD